MRMLTSNFQAALSIAIKNQAEYEESIGYTSDSAFLAGMKTILEASYKEEITIEENTNF